MSGSMNKVILIGNVGRDPEIRHSQDGRKIVSLSIATSESWRDRVTNERQDRTEWHRVVVFNEKISEVIEKYVKKGAKIYLEGQLQTRKWNDAQGAERYTTEVVIQRYRGELVMLDGRSDSGSRFEESNNQSDSGFGSFGGASVGMGATQPSAAYPKDFDDEIPF